MDVKDFLLLRVRLRSMASQLDTAKVGYTAVILTAVLERFRIRG